MGGGGRHLSRHAGNRRSGRRSRRADPALAKGVRLADRRNLLGARHPLSPVRADGAVRRSADQSLRHAADCALGVGAHHYRLVAFAGDDTGMATHDAVGRGDWARHRTDRARARRHRRDAMVRDPPRSGDRPFDRELGNWAARFSAAARQRVRTARLARCRSDSLWHARAGCPCRACLDARPPRRRRLAAFRSCRWRCRGGRFGRWPDADHAMACPAGRQQNRRVLGLVRSSSVAQAPTA